VKIYPRSLKFDRIHMATLTIKQNGFKNVRVSVKILDTTVYLNTELAQIVISTGWFPNDHVLYNADRTRSIINIELTEIAEASLLPTVADGKVLTDNRYSWTNNVNNWDITDGEAEKPLNPMVEANAILERFVSSGSPRSTVTEVGDLSNDKKMSTTLRGALFRLARMYPNTVGEVVKNLSYGDRSVLSGCDTEPADCTCEDFELLSSVVRRIALAVPTLPIKARACLSGIDLAMMLDVIYNE